ncbi:MAF1 protein [Pholiota conissans]|uniref:MAF1 protein n=1 Tax=Pholiota conissans TaxID=109636 RepID=A0A9P5ZF11_9AGAR|nr:MAF1 protein [Pholiota conissans]
MKYIEIPSLSHLAQSLTHEGPECSVHTRMEAYSCKNIKRDKKLFKTLESAYQDDVSNSPPLPSWLALDREAEMTPFGPIDKQASRKTLYLLIATLNVAFPDHEFSDVRPSHFIKEQDGANILNALSNTLIAPQRAGSNAPRSYSSYPPTSSDFFPSSEPSSSSPYDRKLTSPLSPPPIVSGTHPTLFRLIDDVIGLSECEVFSYTPEIDADPHANDFSDDEDDVASIADEASSSEEDGTFEFDNYDIDELKPRRYSGNTKIPPPTPRAAINYAAFDDFDAAVSSNLRLKRRGALLWSSHWFFFNRKKKRILFISVWARSRGIGRMYTSDDEEFEMPASNERFKGWEGSVGLGARTLGLHSR